MKACETEPITEANLDQAVERLSELKGRIGAARKARWAAYIIGSLLLLFLILMLIGVSAIPETLLHDSEDTPLLKALLVFLISFLDVLPEAWYIRVPICAVAVYLVSSIFYQLIQIVLYVLLRGRKGRISLPKDRIAKAKKLYRITGRLLDEDSVSVITFIFGGLGALAIAGSVVYETLTEGGDLLENWAEWLVTPLLFGILVMIICAVFLFVNFLVDPVKKKDTDAVLKLHSAFHEYWLSVDPEEKTREAKLRAALHTDIHAFVADLPQYQQYKADAAQSMGYGSSSGAPPSSGLTYKDHDDLDAVQRAIDRHDNDVI